MDEIHSPRLVGVLRKFFHGLIHQHLFALLVIFDNI